MEGSPGAFPGSGPTRQLPSRAQDLPVYAVCGKLRRSNACSACKSRHRIFPSHYSRSDLEEVLLD